MVLRQMEIVTDAGKLKVDIQETCMNYKTIKQWAYILHDIHKRTIVIYILVGHSYSYQFITLLLRFFQTVYYYNSLFKVVIVIA